MLDNDNGTCAAALESACRDAPARRPIAPLLTARPPHPPQQQHLRTIRNCLPIKNLDA